ncbi:hypothetical protein VE01_09461 [Pseudogymnoascus verrucosus]|uniref:Uncharacterized protein n=1 Tax=Pseudogymnoascus verrucosus TaxID=342668 RepID=A0A1B8G9N5_9PEZI|nr:uncharacterized protein VE01_09461 [Pseudogymnoascus verrucosus]OBT92542.1 hypothetical protein VE01_09461 [Pseudogymnoascus verrucosus]
MRLCVSDSKPAQLRRLRNGSQWINEQISKVYATLGHQATEKIFQSPMSINQYGTLGQSPKESKKYLSEHLVSAKVTPTLSQAYIPLFLPSFVQVMLGDDYTLHQVCKLLNVPESFVNEKTISLCHQYATIRDEPGEASPESRKRTMDEQPGSSGKSKKHKHNVDDEPSTSSTPTECLSEVAGEIKRTTQERPQGPTCEANHSLESASSKSQAQQSSTPEINIENLVSGRPDLGGSSGNGAANSGFSTSLGSDPTISNHPSNEPNRMQHVATNQIARNLSLESPAADLAAATMSQTGRLYNYAPTSHACDLTVTEHQQSTISQFPSNLDLLVSAQVGEHTPITAEWGCQRESIGQEVYNDGACGESWGIQEDFIRGRPMSGQEELTGMLPTAQEEVILPPEQQEMRWGIQDEFIRNWPTSAQEEGILPVESLLEQQEMHWGIQDEFIRNWPTSAQEEGILPVESLPEQQEMHWGIEDEFIRNWPTSAQEEGILPVESPPEQQEMHWGIEDGFIRNWPTSAQEETWADSTGILPLDQQEIQDKFIRIRDWLMSVQEEGILPPEQQEMRWGIEDEFIRNWLTSAQEEGILPVESLPEQQEMHWGIEDEFIRNWPTSAQEETWADTNGNYTASVAANTLGNPGGIHTPKFWATGIIGRTSASVDVI